VIDHDKDLKLIEFLSKTFTGAINEAQKALVHIHVPDNDDDTPEQKELERRYRAAHPAPLKHPMNTTPQACAILLCTGALVAGVAFNPVSPENLDAEDPVQIAFSTLQKLPGLKKGFKIVAVAITTTSDQKSGKLTDIDLKLFEYSLSQLPNLTALHLIVVDPVTNTTTYSAPFSDYRIL
jgi:hypothetical protein